MSFIPYGKQIVDDSDIAAVVETLKSDWLTTGPVVSSFEEEFSRYVTAEHAVAVSNGTAALHLALASIGVGPGDEVIVPAITFVATANAARYLGATVKFADIDERTWLIDPDSVAQLVTDRTKAVLSVDYAGMPCDYDALRAVTEQHDLWLIADACHAPGAEYRGVRVGSVADITAFSFHPVKHLTTGEGGMVTTSRPDVAERLRSLRSHGIRTDFRQREHAGTWEYDQVDLGFNYRISDINCALGRSQLQKQPGWVATRRELAERYTSELEGLPVTTQAAYPESLSSWHLFPIRISGPGVADVRGRVFTSLRNAGIGVNVHYRPVYLNSYYRDLGYEPGLCPVAESVYDGLLSLPMWPGLTHSAQDRVVDELAKALKAA